VSGKVGVVVSRFNHEITSRLRESCLKTLERGGVKPADVRVITVPGGYELPWTVNELALSKKYGVVIALGCILKGSTPQNDHISRSTVQRLHDISVATRVPVILGVITPNTHAQAVARSRGALDRGKEAAQAALEMLKVREELAHGA
jgi:6,7-dimethyl-8-ribityllumazine synthase